MKNQLSIVLICLFKLINTSQYWTQEDLFDLNNERMRMAFITTSDYLRQNVQGVHLVSPIAGYSALEGHTMYFRVVVGMLNQTVFNIFDVKLTAGESTDNQYKVLEYNQITQFTEMNIHSSSYFQVHKAVGVYCSEELLNFEVLRYLQVAPDEDYLITMPVVKELKRIVLVLAHNIKTNKYEVVAEFNLIH